MIDSSTRIRKIGLSIGEVIFLKLCHGPAPSTLADSYSSAGMDFSPASTVTAMNGNDCQTTSSVATVYAGSAPFVAQLNCAQCWPPPSQCGSRASAQLTIPPSGLKNQTKITDAATAGM